VFLVNRVTDAPLVTEFPDSSASAFRYALLRVTFRDGQMTWLDTGLRHLAFGHVPPFAQDAAALPVVAMGQPAFVRTPKLPPEADTTETVFDLVLDAQGQLRGKARETLCGYTAAITKEAHAALPANMRRQLAQQRLSQYFSGCAMDTCEADGLADIGPILVHRYTLSGGGFARKEGAELVFGLGVPPVSLSRTFLGLRKRQFPLLIGSPVYATTITTIHIPEQLKVTSAPAAAQSSTEFGSYSLEVEHAPGTLCVKRRMLLPISRIQPADYAKFAEFCEKVDAAERAEWKAGP
jgi:hypothetical protein